MLLLLCGLSNELARNLAAGSNEAHNVGMERQLALQIHLILEQLQSSRVQPCVQQMYYNVSDWCCTRADVTRGAWVAAAKHLSDYCKQLEWLPQRV
jgi:hypothetical protein